MKYNLLLIVFFASRLLSFGELSEKEIKQLKRDVQIAGVRTNTQRTEDRKKIEILQVNTFQNQDDSSVYRIRFAVELKDKEKKTYIAEFTGAPSGDYDSEYEGEDYWELYMPYEELEGLNVTAYAIQYGVMDGETFLPLADVQKNYEKMMDGIAKKTTSPFPAKVMLFHYYMYDDSTDGSTESTPQRVKAVK
ncbi:MAG: hypothetical protein PHP93_03545 [Kiritimatiellales bacterium]|nr:hypothetical protein [Kiritimatiellales bacterium]